MSKGNNNVQDHEYHEYKRNRRRNRINRKESDRRKMENGKNRTRKVRVRDEDLENE